MSKQKVKKVVLAYSGGLDTSIILKWLQTVYGAEVVTFTADLGQGEELGPAREKALLLGVKPENIFIEDLREEFVRDYVFPMFRANAQYEGLYLLGTSIARPLIAKKQIEIARKMGADTVCHGATGKGNDQVRFELGYYALEPDITIIAPWREWDFVSRTDLINFAEAHQIPIAKDKRGEAPFSVDANLLHSSSEGKVLEDPWVEPPEYVHMRTISPEEAPDRVTEITIDFEKGDATAVDGIKMSPATLLTKLNELGKANGIGRLDLTENRFVGMKSRGVYETPGGTILMEAVRGLEQLVLDRETLHFREKLALEAQQQITDLEQTGLLSIDYASLDDLIADEDAWSGLHGTLVSASPTERPRRWPRCDNATPSGTTARRAGVPRGEWNLRGRSTCPSSNRSMV